MEERIIKIVAEILEMEPEKIDINMQQEDVEEWDSLAHIRIIAEIEEQLGKNIDIDKVVEIHSIKDLITLVQEG